MAILTERDREAVRGELAKLAGPVKLIVFSTSLGASEYCVETERLVKEVAECSDQVTVDILNLHIDRDRAAAYGVDRVPAIVVEGARDYGLRFYGAPTGYEFSNLIDAIILASTGEPTLSDATMTALAGLPRDVEIKVFSTPT